MIFQIISYPILLFIAYRLFQTWRGYCAYKELVAQGVRFPNGFSYLADIMDLNDAMQKQGTGLADWTQIMEKKLDVARLPHLTGVIFFG